MVKNQPASRGNDTGNDPWSGWIPLAAEQLTPCTTTPEPVLQSLGAATTEPSAGTCAWQQEAPPQGEACMLLPSATRASPHTAVRTQRSRK